MLVLNPKETPPGITKTAQINQSSNNAMDFCILQLLRTMNSPWVVVMV